MKKRNGKSGSPAEPAPPEGADPPDGGTEPTVSLSPGPPATPAAALPDLSPTTLAANGAIGVVPVLPAVAPDGPPPPSAPPAERITLAPGTSPGRLSEADRAGLELRLRRLEDALAQLQDLQAMEARVAERVAGRLIHEPPGTPAEAHAAVLLEFGKRLLRAPVEAARHVVTRPGSPIAGAGHRLRFVREAAAELRAIFRMFVDPRYRLSWAGRLVPAALVFLFATSWWWVPGTSIPLFGTLLNKTVDLSLAYALFKVLGREAQRYRETAPDLPPSLRL
jgi:hypothetical protein